jgi:hypothetical protein
MQSMYQHHTHKASTRHIKMQSMPRHVKLDTPVIKYLALQVEQIFPLLVYRLQQRWLHNL